MKNHNLELVQAGHLFGVEDVINENKFYTSTVVCEKEGDVFAMTK